MIIDGKKIMEITWQPREVVTEPKQIALRALGFSIQNMGDSTVILNHIWTLLPRATLQLGSSEDTNILVVDLRIQFKGGTTNRLEISEMTTNHPLLANYIEQHRNG